MLKPKFLDDYDDSEADLKPLRLARTASTRRLSHPPLPHRAAACTSHTWTVRSFWGNSREVGLVPCNVPYIIYNHIPIMDPD